MPQPCGCVFVDGIKAMRDVWDNLKVGASPKVSKQKIKNKKKEKKRKEKIKKKEMFVGGFNIRCTNQAPQLTIGWITLRAEGGGGWVGVARC